MNLASTDQPWSFHKMPLHWFIHLINLPTAFYGSKGSSQFRRKTRYYTERTIQWAKLWSEVYPETREASQRRWADICRDLVRNNVDEGSLRQREQHMQRHGDLWDHGTYGNLKSFCRTDGSTGWSNLRWSCRSRLKRDCAMSSVLCPTGWFSPTANK